MTTLRCLRIPERERLCSLSSADDLDLQVLRPSRLSLGGYVVLVAARQLQADVRLVGEVELPRPLTHKNDPVVGDGDLSQRVGADGKFVDSAWKVKEFSLHVTL